MYIVTRFPTNNFAIFTVEKLLASLPNCGTKSTNEAGEGVPFKPLIINSKRKIYR